MGQYCHYSFWENLWGWIKDIEREAQGKEWKEYNAASCNCSWCILFFGLLVSLFSPTKAENFDYGMPAAHIQILLAACMEGKNNNSLQSCK